jgi:hypothetical protein
MQLSFCEAFLDNRTSHPVMTLCKKPSNSLFDLLNHECTLYQKVNFFGIDAFRLC